MTARPNVALTADAVLLIAVRGKDRVLLVRRGSDPYAGRWALPGGFVEAGESPGAGVRRELLEETGHDLGAVPLVQLGTYGDPGRDPRGHVVSVAHRARLRPVDDEAALPRVTGGDDAADARWVPLDEALEDGVLAFDHATVLRDALQADGAASPASAIAVRFDLPDAAALAEFDRLVDDLLPGIRSDEPGTLTYAVHEVADAPLARLFFETYAADGHALHEARPRTAEFLARIQGLISGARVEHLTQRGSVRR